MTPTTPAAVLSALNWRYATKKFDSSRTIPAETWSALEQAAVLAPSSYGLQPWKFVVVTDPGMRTKLRAAAYNQSQITDASHLVVFCRRKPFAAADVERLIDRVAQVRSVTRESLAGYRDSMLGMVKSSTPEQLDVWSGNQAFIALGTFLTAAALIGVDCCPMGGFDAAKFDEILNLPAQGYSATVLAAAGYRAGDDPMAKHTKVRWAKDDAIMRV